MSTSLFFSILATILYLIGFIPYIYHVFHGRVVPHPFSWTIWCILSGINTYALYTDAGLQMSLFSPVNRTLALGLGAVIGWTLIRRISIGIFDYICLALAGICILIAARYGATNAVIPTIIVDALVLSPTVKKIWNDPESEDVFAWILVVFSQICIIISLEHHTIENSLYWTYEILANGCVAFFIYRRKLYMSSWRFFIRKIADFFALKKGS